MCVFVYIPVTAARARWHGLVTPPAEQPDLTWTTKHIKLKYYI